MNKATIQDLLQFVAPVNTEAFLSIFNQYLHQLHTPKSFRKSKEDTLIAIACDVWSLKITEVTDTSLRKGPIVECRSAIWFFSKKYNISSIKIAKAFCCQPSAISHVRNSRHGHIYDRFNDKTFKLKCQLFVKMADDVIYSNQQPDVQKVTDV